MGLTAVKSKYIKSEKYVYLKKSRTYQVIRPEGVPRTEQAPVYGFPFFFVNIV